MGDRQGLEIFKVCRNLEGRRHDECHGESEPPNGGGTDCQGSDAGLPLPEGGGNHLGKYCEPQNNEFMLCRFETDDPRKCLKDGAAVTDCSLEFFSKVKAACPAELTRYAMCLEKSDSNLKYSACRETGAAFDGCMKEKMGLDRPHFGYHSLV